MKLITHPGPANTINNIKSYLNSSISWTSSYVLPHCSVLICGGSGVAVVVVVVVVVIIVVVVVVVVVVLMLLLLVLWW